MSEIRDWFMTVPPITRAWFGLSVALPLLGRIGLLNPYYMILTSRAWTGLELWRPITATFFYPITPQSGFHYLINLYFLYNYSKNLETGEFSTRPADYLFLLIFNWLALVLFGVFANLMLLMDPLILSVIYVWCQLNQETIVSFWFGTRFQAKYLPWVLLGFNVLLGGGGFHELLGIVVGHLYYYVKYKYPQDNQTELISTPSILYRYLPNQQQIRSPFNAFPTASSTRNIRPSSAATSGGGMFAAARNVASGGGGYNWGRGQVLGNRTD